MVSDVEESSPNCSEDCAPFPITAGSRAGMNFATSRWFSIVDTSLSNITAIESVLMLRGDDARGLIRTEF